MLYTSGGGCPPQLRQNGPKQTRSPRELARHAIQDCTRTAAYDRRHHRTRRMGPKSRLPRAVHNNGRIYLAIRSRAACLRGNFRNFKRERSDNSTVFTRHVKNARKYRDSRRFHTSGTSSPFPGYTSLRTCDDMLACIIFYYIFVLSE